ncbi:MAG TPA: twin-arginine translocase subunit TatC [Candidatus Polarisedimenticolaceae bacterium]|nr:twin-arginine translocase subunit TatC [Candidatus Polarisedimenticolaceae bacterium]
MIPPGRSTFREHLDELRSRLLRVVAAVGVAFVVTYGLRAKLWAWVSLPLGKVIERQTAGVPAPPSPFGFTDPAEPFLSGVRLALWASAFLVAPVIFHQLWGFIGPGLLPRERRLTIPFVVVTSLCFLGGCAFAYFQAFAFLAEVLYREAAAFGLRPNIHMGEYLDLFLGTVLLTGVMFELPVLFFFLARLRIVTAGWMLKYWRHATVIVVIFSAFFTPGDVVATTIFFSAVLLGLYLISIVVVWFAQPTPRPEAG